MEIEQAELEILVLEAYELSVSDDTALSSAPSRSSLYFDEKIKVFVVLRTPNAPIDLESYLAHLQINIDVQAFGSDNQSSDGQSQEALSAQPQGKGVIWSGIVDRNQEPISRKDGGTDTFVWAVECFLHRPRVRMQHPMIFFKATAVFKHPRSNPHESADPVLPSGVPASINILESLSGDPGLRGTRPQLTESRLDRINLSSTSAIEDRIIRSVAQKPFPAIPAISARVRYSKAGAYTGRPSIVASLEIETAPFQDDEIELTHVNMELSDGSVEDLCKGCAIDLPMKCQPRDSVVFLFRLLPDAIQTQVSNATSPSKSLDIAINARVLVSETCRPSIHMKWKTGVDFATALNPKFGSPNQAMQRSNRPSTFMVASDTDKHLTQDEAASSEAPQTNERASSLHNFGITLTLTAPKDIHIGQPFTWDLFLVNHSSKARKLAIIVIPKRRPGDHKTHMPKGSASSSHLGHTGKLDHADAVMDENRLYAIQKSQGREDVGIVCLSTEVRLGTLNPGFCHNTELKFLPLAKGILHIEAVRVVDLVESNSIDVRDLPEIVAEERALDE